MMLGFNEDLRIASAALWLPQGAFDAIEQLIHERGSNREQEMMAISLTLSKYVCDRR